MLYRGWREPLPGVRNVANAACFTENTHSTAVGPWEVKMPGETTNAAETAPRTLVCMSSGHSFNNLTIGNTHIAY